jgi:hypothetical protein
MKTKLTVRPRKIAYTALTLLSAALFQNCGGELKLEDMLPEASGQANEIYVFCENSVWNDTIGRYVQGKLEERSTNLPQPEKRFTVYQFQPEGMNKARLTHRNIIEIVINQRNENKEARLVRKGSRGAKNQLMFEFKGQKKEELLEVLNSELPEILDEISKKEIERHHVKFKNRPNRSAQNKLSETLRLRVYIPKKLVLQKSINDTSGSFTWLEAKGASPEGSSVLHQGVFVYTYPYVDDSTFSSRYLISKRDSVLKDNVLGSRDDQYLKTLLIEGKHPSTKEINFNGNYAIEMRGEYTMHNGFMGGPFVSVTTFDEIKNRIVTVEGYCYAPQLKKRDFLKEMESVVYSLSFSE